jgi:hypothetical protein
MSDDEVMSAVVDTDDPAKAVNWLLQTSQDRWLANEYTSDDITICVLYINPSTSTPTNATTYVSGQNIPTGQSPNTNTISYNSNGHNNNSNSNGGGSRGSTSSSGDRLTGTTSVNSMTSPTFNDHDTSDYAHTDRSTLTGRQQTVPAAGYANTAYSDHTTRATLTDIDMNRLSWLDG